MAKTARLQARISPEILDMLKEMAEKEHRPVGNMIEILIIEGYMNQRHKVYRDVEELER